MSKKTHAEDRTRARFPPAIDHGMILDLVTAKWSMRPRSRVYMLLYLTSPLCQLSFHDSISHAEISLFRSQVDTTSIQALVDTRDAVQRWAGHPVEVCLFYLDQHLL